VVARAETVVLGLALGERLAGRVGVAARDALGERRHVDALGVRPRRRRPRPRARLGLALGERLRAPK